MAPSGSVIAKGGKRCRRKASVPASPFLVQDIAITRLELLDHELDIWCPRDALAERNLAHRSERRNAQLAGPRNQLPFAQRMELVRREQRNSLGVFELQSEQWRASKFFDAEVGSPELCLLCTALNCCQKRDCRDRANVPNSKGSR